LATALTGVKGRQKALTVLKKLDDEHEKKAFSFP
jgi:hypothetical protein